MSTDGQGAAHVPAGEGKKLWVADELMTFVVSGEDTGGAYSLTDSVVPPQGGRRLTSTTGRTRPFGYWRVSWRRLWARMLLRWGRVFRPSLQRRPPYLRERRRDARQIPHADGTGPIGEVLRGSRQAGDGSLLPATLRRRGHRKTPGGRTEVRRGDTTSRAVGWHSRFGFVAATSLRGFRYGTAA